MSFTQTEFLRPKLHNTNNLNSPVDDYQRQIIAMRSIIAVRLLDILSHHNQATRKNPLDCYKVTMNGSIILCDHVYETKDGKFVISGTYNHWLCQSQTLTIPQLHCYIRLYPERLGEMACKIILRDENIIRNQQAIMTDELKVDVRAEHIPVMEFAFHSNLPAEIRVNIDPKNPPSENIVIPLSLCLMIDDEIVATSPLKVSFLIHKT